MELEKVINKLRKLKNLYEGAKSINSLGEAANAASVIQRLLSEYNLTMSEVELKSKSEEDLILEQITSGYTYKAIGGSWEYRLLTVLCSHNFCKCFEYGTSYKNLIMFGKKENMDMVNWLREVLSRNFVNFSNEEYKKLKDIDGVHRLDGEKINKDKFQRTYLSGCVRGLDAKLCLKEEETKEKDNDFKAKVTSLTIRNNQMLDEHISRKFGKIRQKHRGVTNTDATFMGFRRGYATDVNQPIENQKNNVKNIRFLG